MGLVTKASIHFYKENNISVKQTISLLRNYNLFAINTKRMNTVAWPSLK